MIDAGDDGADGHGVNLGLGLASGVGAGAGDVGIRSLGHDLTLAGGEEPVVGVVHETAVAAVVDGVAGSELLVRDSGEGVAGDEPHGLDVTGGGEGPAGAAGALVLDGGDGTLVAPVNLLAGGGDDVGERSLDGMGGLSHSLLVEGGTVDAGGELGVGHVSELVGAEDGEGVGGLEDLRLLHVLDEVLEAGGLLGGISVRLEVGGLELAEHGIVVLIGKGNGREDGDEKESLHGDEG